MQAVVTGATSGIGRAIALALHAKGLEVIALGRQPEALAHLERTGLRSLCVDLTDREKLRQSVAHLTPDVLVNNAGIMPPLGNFCDMAETDIDRTICTNISSAINLTRILAPVMRQRGKGHVFFTGSTAGHAPFANMAVYCASKAAISGFAQALRLDLAPSGVRVTEIVAGRVETALYKGILPQQTRDAMYANNGSVQPEDVAAMVLAALALPASVDVSRFDILPTHQGPATGSKDK